MKEKPKKPRPRSSILEKLKSANDSEDVAFVAKVIEQRKEIREKGKNGTPLTVEYFRQKVENESKVFFLI